LQKIHIQDKFFVKGVVGVYIHQFYIKNILLK
jgi:hypothetical protein